MIEQEKSSSGGNALLVQVDVGRDHGNNIEELKQLVLTAGALPAEVLSCRCKCISSKYYIGTGKLEEIKQLVECHSVSLIVFNNELSPTQQRNIEKIVQCRVLDRTEIILDIFAMRAKTYEGKLQVELAQLKHLSTRLVRGWTHLERQKGGIGLRGPGETQLETDRRLIGARIKTIEARLSKVRMQRQQSRRLRERNNTLTVALVGYTNVGKSSLFNWVSDTDVYVQDQLFATLDPTSRTLKVPALGDVILVDTVGFIQGLPHDLVNAFRATLEEAALADLLLHVVDASHPEKMEHVKEVRKVLHEIGAEHVPELMAYNKIDLLAGPVSPRLDLDEQGAVQRVWVSVASKLGQPLLVEAIAKRLQADFVHCSVKLSHNQGRIRSRWHDRQFILSEQSDRHGHFLLEVKLPSQEWARVQAQLCVNEPLKG